MGRRLVNIFTLAIFFTLLVVCLTGCTSILVKDSYYFDFFETGRLLMTEDEIETYRHLPDSASKEAFIAEFWERRDPDPQTEENEFRQEFEDRIAYANKMFGSPIGKLEESRGWNTDPGRIYLVLGPPDRQQTIWREAEPATEVVRVREEEGGGSVPQQWIQEQVWHYEEHQMTLVFLNRRGRWYLDQPPPGLLSVLDEARASLIGGGRRGRDIPHRLRFGLSYEEAVLLITVPTDRVAYAEEDDALRAGFRVAVLVLLDGESLEKLTENTEFRLTEEELMGQDELVIAIPYALDRAGVYVFDVTVEDILAVPPSPYRRTLRITH